MPSNHVPIFPHDLSAELAAHRERAREIFQKASELLKMSEPDTFLGRQHYPLVPPPNENEE